MHLNQSQIIATLSSKKNYKKRVTEMFSNRTILLYVHADTEVILEEASSKIRRIAESIGYPHCFGVTMRKPSNVIKSIGNTNLDDCDD